MHRIRIGRHASQLLLPLLMVTVSACGGSSDSGSDPTPSPPSELDSVSTLADTNHATSDGASVGPDGNIYVSGGPDSQDILQVTPTGDVSTFATGFDSANGSDFDSNGNLYVADYRASAVRKITPDGTMTTLASSLDGPAGVWVDLDGNILVSLFGANFSGTGATVLSITPDGEVSTFASGDGLQDVIGVVGDEDGRIYASNWSTGEVYEITEGTVTLLAETGGGANQICYNSGSIYVPSPDDALIRRVSLEGTVETFAGSSELKSADGPIADADFLQPNSCDFSADGTVLYLMDRGTGLLREVSSDAP